MISQVESFLCPDKQGTPEEGRSIQRPKRCEKNNNDEDNSPKTLTDKNDLNEYRILVLKFTEFQCVCVCVCVCACIYIYVCVYI